MCTTIWHGLCKFFHLATVSRHKFFHLSKMYSVLQQHLRKGRREVPFRALQKLPSARTSNYSLCYRSQDGNPSSTSEAKALSLWLSGNRLMTVLRSCPISGVLDGCIVSFSSCKNKTNPRVRQGFRHFVIFKFSYSKISKFPDFP